MSLTVKPPGTPSARRERTRRRLMEAAVHVVAEKGVNGASVEEICERAGFTRGAFYSNFGSKEDLCLAVMRQHVEDHLARANEALDSAEQEGLDAEHTLVRAVDLVVDSQDAESETLLTMHELRLLAIRNPEVRGGFLEMEEQTDAMVASIIERGIERHGLRLVLPGREVGRLLGSVFEQGLLDAALHDRRGDKSAVKRQMVAVLRALMTDAPTA
ncbi:TetR/AcrR family transcriptional regulator [Auraticoccus monumenti]|uniref:DNA-binding transcriptional regulator, AcrR family n=1 Tax=Auraticoccus monumenti TaxID=675864 RepID=A0A1G6T2F9_9ACTN|nr:TetR/AcrR family transcriptional regulator [Auraticoccus monumenti]SDD22726.1 DNA-binding transcriptional regulator, AcrR family [Auraticoccus monumenti]